MAGLGISLTADRLAQLDRDLVAIKNGVPMAISGAINETLAETRTAMSRGITEKVAIKARDIKPHLAVIRSTPKTLAGTLKLSESSRIRLKYFGARQTKQGVTYRISRDGGRKMIRSAFGPNTPRLGGQVFRRAGKTRLPLIGPMKGPSPWGVVVKSGMDKTAAIDAQAALEKNLGQRVNYLVLKAGGQLPVKAGEA
jgi:hypothetical protein